MEKTKSKSTYWCGFLWFKPKLLWHKQHEIWVKCLYQGFTLVTGLNISIKKIEWNLYVSFNLSEI